MRLFILTIVLLLAAGGAGVAQTPASQTAKDHFDRGSALIKENKYADALEAFQRSAAMDPSQAATHGNIGAMLMALDRAAEAIPAYREAI